MDDQTLQALSKALTLLIFRNGAVENCAASEAILDDVTMKILNKDVNNRFIRCSQSCSMATGRMLKNWNKC